MAHFKSFDPSVVGKILKAPDLGVEPESRVLAHHLCPRIIESYSQCRLSKSEDKLIALAGIAKGMRLILQDEYVVGMWKRYLASELGWYVKDHRQSDGSPSQRASPYRAPSFSWASIDGCISAAISTDEGLLCSVADLSIDYMTEDRTGLVKGGHLLLKGALKRLQIRRFGSSGEYFININGSDVAFKTDDGHDHNPTTVFLDVDQDSFDLENDPAVLFYMALVTRESEEVGTSFQGLMLLHQGGGTFVRLGVCETESWDDEELITRFRAHDENEASLPCLSFHPDDHAQTIKIV